MEGRELNHTPKCSLINKLQLVIFICYACIVVYKFLQKQEVSLHSGK